MLDSQKKSLLTVVFLSFVFTFAFYSQNSAVQIINYYGLISSDLDSNMSKMTSDLYYTQLCELSALVVNDLRTDDASVQNEDSIKFSHENLNLYFKVNKKEDSSKWVLSMYLFDNNNQQTHSEIKEFDSFYKILMEPKTSLQESLRKLIYSKSEKLARNSTPRNSEISFPEFSGTTKNLSTEEFSGTWAGENYIDKIVILRGGRGFVIFNNGASMNISVSIKQNNSANLVVVTQTSRTNASFFPNLDRKLALASANTAAPIEWNFQIIDSNTLSGTKKTLIQNNDGTSVIEGEEMVVWNRKS